MTLNWLLSFCFGSLFFCLACFPFHLCVSWNGRQEIFFLKLNYFENSIFCTEISYFFFFFSNFVNFFSFFFSFFGHYNHQRNLFSFFFRSVDHIYLTTKKKKNKKWSCALTCQQQKKNLIYFMHLNFRLVERRCFTKKKRNNNNFSIVFFFITSVTITAHVIFFLRQYPTTLSILVRQYPILYVSILQIFFINCTFFIFWTI